MTDADVSLLPCFSASPTILRRSRSRPDHVIKPTGHVISTTKTKREEDMGNNVIAPLRRKYQHEKGARRMNQTIGPNSLKIKI